jgi:hypothetical protein
MTVCENELRSELQRIADTLVITSPSSFVFADLPEVTVDVNSGRADSNSEQVDKHQKESDFQR